MDFEAFEAGRVMLDEALNIAARWAPEVETRDMDFLHIANNLKFVHVPADLYLSMISRYSETIRVFSKTTSMSTPLAVCSGMMFFYGCAVFIIHFPDWSKHLEPLFLYSLLYILVDHYIDDENKSQCVKKQSVKHMKSLIEGNPLAEDDNIDPVLFQIDNVYKKLLSLCPGVETSIRKLFYSEIRGLSVQENKNPKIKDCYNVCVEKGGLTMSFLAILVGEATFYKSCYELGCVMQLIDDLIDIEDDLCKKINTVATVEKTQTGNLDAVWIDVMRRINAIDEKFVIFKPFYTFLAMHAVSRYPINYNPEVRKIAEKSGAPSLDMAAFFSSQVAGRIKLNETFTCLQVE